MLKLYCANFVLKRKNLFNKRLFLKKQLQTLFSVYALNQIIVLFGITNS